MEAGMKTGDTVLIQAGASGLGMAAIQLAKAFGAEVVTTVGSAAKAEAVRRLGADVVVRRNLEHLDRVLEEHPVDIAMDCVGGPDLGAHLERLARGGRWILIGTLGGERSEIALRPILQRGLRLIGSMLRSRSDEMKAAVLRKLEADVWPRIETGEIQPVIYRVLPIQEAEEAHAILARNENIGKVVLKVRP
jgi:NADPH2:quinone reductase